MHRPTRLFLSLALSLVGLPACDDDGPAPGRDATVAADGGVSDGAREVIPVPANSAAIKLVDGPAILLGGYAPFQPRGCSRGPMAAAGGPWCAFGRFNQRGELGEIWVVNVAKANQACDGGPDCLRLSSKPAELIMVHGFHGDTLIFHERPAELSDLWVGPAFAWRPGMTAPVAIGPEKTASCEAAPGAPVAWCQANFTPSGQSMKLDLLAGRIEAGGAPLPLLAQIIDSATTPFTPQFSPSGDHFGYLTGGSSAANPAILRIAPVADMGDRGKYVEAGRDVQEWRLSADSKRVFFLRDFDNVELTGKLVVAPFPPPGAETALAEAVYRYQLVDPPGGPPSLYALSAPTPSGAGTLMRVADLTRPGPATELRKDVLPSVDASPDGRFLHYSTGAGGGEDLRIMKADGSGGCVLADKAAMPYMFAPSGNLVYWLEQVEPSPDGFALGQGWVADPDGCKNKRKISDLLFDLTVVRDDLVLFVKVDNDGSYGLRLARLPDPHQFPDSSSELQRGMGSFSHVPEAVVYSLKSPNDGLYLLPVPGAR